MRVPLSWLKDYVKLDLSNEALAEVLTLAGLEVDKVEPTPFPFKGVIVAEVKEAAPHPNADKLKVAQVFDGTETVQVVCGAANCRAGMKVALATVGATLTNKEGSTFKIKKSKLRDVASHGMLCAEDELGFTEESSGIMELSDAAAVGTDLTELFGDVIFEVSLTPNLGHCMSLLGIAREVAALLDQKAIPPKITLDEGGAAGIEVEIKEPENCYRYGCRWITGVKVGPSPDWMKTRLENAGIRSINNVVDVTNYVMLEMGQPLHAFDGKKIRDQKISVQSTESSIPFETLDGEKRTIPPGILMIHDGKGPVAVAGVMGGANSEVSETTTEVILEAAHFNPSAVRKGAKMLGLRSESSARFERGVDFERVTAALDRAASLLGGTVSQIVDSVSKERKRKTVKVRLSRVNALLGTELSLAEVESFLKRLEMTVKTEEETCHVTVPTYRNDITEEIDLIEEVARIYGYNNIEKQEPRVVNSSLPHAPIYLMKKEVRERLIGAGLQEFLTCDLISSELSNLCLEKQLGEKEEIHVLKPSSVDQSILRMSLLPGMLQAVKHNFDRKNHNLSAFEVGRIHFKEGKGFQERLTAAILLTGKRTPHHFESKPGAVDFFDLKGILENLLTAFDVKGAQFEPSRLKSFHPGKQATLSIGDLRLGVLGEVHPSRLERLGIEERIFFAQIDLHDLIEVRGKEKKMTPLPQFPGSERDWTVTVQHDVPMGSFSNVLKAFPSKLLKEFYLLDLYESEKIGKDRKNVTFRFVYRNDRQTIEQPQVDKEHERMIRFVNERMGDFIFQV
ncbi:phenylalanine--tRNA ligase subunit beta [Candidatus Neptunochlamydia vexilliferae]|nr:phenylalanine--tRNA ligase subunit beta [Candidatus Neptunochlamydia vexilliferae]